MYKWKKENGLFELLFEQNRINGVRKIKAINHQNETLLITKSASNVNLYNCGSDTDNILWKYSEGDTQVLFCLYMLLVLTNTNYLLILIFSLLNMRKFRLSHFILVLLGYEVGS